MIHADLPLESLREYRTSSPEPDDLDAFWAGTLLSAPVEDASFDRVDTGLALIETFDATFPGYGGHPIRAWLHVPARATEPLPTIVEYIGAGGGRGRPHEPSLWANAGWAHFIMDNRGQGAGWRSGVTPDPEGGELSGAPGQGNVITRGILDPASHYYRRLYTDAVRAVDAVRTHPLADPGQVFVAGRSQGGGVSLAVASLRADIAGVMADVPFLSDFPRGVTITDSAPFADVADYLSVKQEHTELALRTLSYFDVAHLAARATAPALVSVALADPICPPSTVFAAYNAYAGPKEIAVYPFNRHEGGGSHHSARQLAWVRERLAG